MSNESSETFLNLKTKEFNLIIKSNLNNNLWVVFFSFFCGLTNNKLIKLHI